MECQKPFSVLLYRRANIIVDHGMGGLAFPMTLHGSEFQTKEDSGIGKLERTSHRLSPRLMRFPWTRTMLLGGGLSILWQGVAIIPTWVSIILWSSCIFHDSIIFLRHTLMHQVGRNFGGSNKAGLVVVVEELMMRKIESYPFDFLVLRLVLICFYIVSLVFLKLISCFGC